VVTTLAAYYRAHLVATAPIPNASSSHNSPRGGGGSSNNSSNNNNNNNNAGGGGNVNDSLKVLAQLLQEGGAHISPSEAGVALFTTLFCSQNTI
jgi:hypothetical protein